MKSYYIKERHNPQLGVYYVACGQMSKTEAKKCEKPGYGDNYMHEYKTKEDYDNAILKLNEEGHRVNGSF